MAFLKGISDAHFAQGPSNIGKACGGTLQGGPEDERRGLEIGRERREEAQAMLDRKNR